MLLKYTIGNILSKPGRLAVILICMTAACLAGYMAIDFGDAYKKTLTNVFTNSAGNANFLVMYQGTGGITDDIFEDLPATESVCAKTLRKREIRRDEKLYNYAITDEVTVYTFSDMDTAHSMELIPYNVAPENGEIAISEEYCRKYGYVDGDVIMLYDTDDNEHPFKVKGTFSPCYFINRYSAVISQESYIMLKGDSPNYSAFVDVKDDDKCIEFKEQMKEKHPNVTVLLENFINEEEKTIIDTITGVLYLAFVLVFVLVIFVTVSFTEKIITERMSVIGTLRSIGMSMRKTTAILLFENILYGILGSIFGFLLYLIVKKIGVSYFFSWAPAQWHSTKVNPMIFLPVMLGAVLIQILVPLKEVLRAVKTSIRDIIFETRDSEYKLSYKKTAAGAVCIVLGLILGAFFDDLYILSTCILLIIFGSALVIQFAVRKLTLLLAKLFESKNMPVAELAARETGSKKPNSGNAVLTVATVSAAAAIFVMVSSMLYAFEKPLYDTDIVVSDTSMKTEKYEYIKDTEGVDDVEYIYMNYEGLKFGEDDKRYTMPLMSLPASGQYLGMGALPSDMGFYEMIIDPPTAAKMNVSEGDSIDITFHYSGIFPEKKTMTVKMITSESQIGTSGMIILSDGLFKELYSDTVSMILIRTSDPGAVKRGLEPTLTNGETVQTLEEFTKESRKDSTKFIAIMLAVMASAIALTLIGISGNQLIGFAARKKEYAMLHSCACSQSKIIRLILVENALLFGISCIAAGLICIPVSSLIARIFVLMDMGLNATIRYNMLFGCIFLLWVITMLTSMTPIKSLKKMNTAMELKYE